MSGHKRRGFTAAPTGSQRWWSTTRRTTPISPIAVLPQLLSRVAFDVTDPGSGCWRLSIVGRSPPESECWVESRVEAYGCPRRTHPSALLSLLSSVVDATFCQQPYKTSDNDDTSASHLTTLVMLDMSSRRTCFPVDPHRSGRAALPHPAPQVHSFASPGRRRRLRSRAGGSG